MCNDDGDQRAPSAKPTVPNLIGSGMTAQVLPSAVDQLTTTAPHVTLFPNYLHYKLNQASSAMVNQVVKVRNQNSKSGVRI
jgi:hypothetical protein